MEDRKLGAVRGELITEYSSARRDHRPSRKVGNNLHAVTHAKLRLEVKSLNRPKRSERLVPDLFET